MLLCNRINYEKLAEKVGIEFETIKSGQHKDMFGGARAIYRRRNSDATRNY